MFVKKYTFVNNLTSSNGYKINIPIGNDIGLVGQQETIDKDFIDIEVEKAINVTFDYEKVKLLPEHNNTDGILNNITYRVNLLNGSGAEATATIDTATGEVDSITISSGGGSYTTVPSVIITGGGGSGAAATATIDTATGEVDSITISSGGGSYTTAPNVIIIGVFNKTLKWSDIGFNNDDLRFKKKSFTKSFLRLDFYDSEIVSNQNLISFITLFPEFSNEDMISGSIPQAVNYEVSFKLGNTLIDRDRNGEGFALYHFKDEVLPNPLPPKNLYMRATFNNSKNGESTGLMSSDDSNLSIDTLIGGTENTSKKNNLFTKYILTRGNLGYYYKIDNTYSSNIDYNNTVTNDYVIQLYQINAI